MKKIANTILVTISILLASSLAYAANDYNQVAKCADAVSKGTVEKLVSVLSGKGWSAELQKKHITEPCLKLCSELVYAEGPKKGEKMNCQPGAHDNTVSARTSWLFTEAQLDKHLAEKRKQRRNKRNPQPEQQ